MSLESAVAAIDKVQKSIQENDVALKNYADTHKAELGETKQVVEKLNTDYAELAKTHEKLQKEIKLIRTIGANSENKDEERQKASVALQKLLKNGMNINALEESERGLLYNSQTTLVDSEGGAAVPTMLEREVYSSVRNLPGMRQVVTARPMGGGEAHILTASTVDAYWVAEGASISSTNAAFGKIKATAHKMALKIPMTSELLEDAGIDLLGLLSALVGDAMLEKEDVAFVSGDGAGKPNGLFVSPALQTSGSYTASGVAAALNNSTYNGIDKLRLLVTSLKGTHRARGGFMMNATTFAQLRNLKDSQGNYLYQWNVEAGKPATFDGYPVYLNDNCPDIAAGAFPIAFGDFNSAYAIRDRRGMTAKIDNIGLIDTDEAKLVVTKRVAGEPVITDTPAVKLFKIATT